VAGIVLRIGTRTYRSRRPAGGDPNLDAVGVILVRPFLPRDCSVRAPMGRPREAEQLTGAACTTGVEAADVIRPQAERQSGADS
jgi:hypothetical protein